MARSPTTAASPTASTTTGAFLSGELRARERPTTPTFYRLPRASTTPRQIRRSSPRGERAPESVVALGGDTLIAEDRSRVYRSLDRGRTWTERGDAPPQPGAATVLDGAPSPATSRPARYVAGVQPQPRAFNADPGAVAARRARALSATQRACAAPSAAPAPRPRGSRGSAPRLRRRGATSRRRRRGRPGAVPPRRHRDGRACDGTAHDGTDLRDANDGSPRARARRAGLRRRGRDVERARRCCSGVATCTGAGRARCGWGRWQPRCGARGVPRRTAARRGRRTWAPSRRTLEVGPDGARWACWTGGSAGGRLTGTWWGTGSCADDGRRWWRCRGRRAPPEASGARLRVEPNPASGAAAVRLVLPSPEASVRVSVFDARGREVAVLACGAARRGRARVRGGYVASGAGRLRGPRSSGGDRRPHPVHRRAVASGGRAAGV